MRNLIWALAMLCLISVVSASDERMLIHEWGTFTSVQNLAGVALGGINSDDESLPQFVKTLSGDLIAHPQSKGFNLAHPDITMRLETPVVYFHPPKNQTAPSTLDFEVKFKGGWLTQYYPDATALAPGLVRGETEKMGRLLPSTLGSLIWPGLKIGVNAELPATKLQVWTAPRAVDAATIMSANGQAEKFLFYRGVANLAAPLKASRAAHDSTDLLIQPQIDGALEGLQDLTIRTLWLAHFKPDGTCAFSELHPENFKLNAGAGVNMKTQFSPGAYSAENIAALRARMQTELVADGLFGDEAAALLKTWEVSYFKSAGLRLFFLVPKAWTNYYLPLKVSVPSDIVRTMVGRIELLSPEQNAALDHISAATDFSVEGIRAIYPDVASLGRFKTPLLWDRMQTQPTPGIKAAATRFAMPLYTLPAR